MLRAMNSRLESGHRHLHVDSFISLQGYSIMRLRLKWQLTWSLSMSAAWSGIPIKCDVIVLDMNSLMYLHGQILCYPVSYSLDDSVCLTTESIFPFPIQRDSNLHMLVPYCRMRPQGAIFIAISLEQNLSLFACMEQLMFELILEQMSVCMFVYILLFV